jgi:hypothetical protein
MTVLRGCATTVIFTYGASIVTTVSKDYKRQKKCSNRQSSYAKDGIIRFVFHSSFLLYTPSLHAFHKWLATLSNLYPELLGQPKIMDDVKTESG